MCARHPGITEPFIKAIIELRDVKTGCTATGVNVVTIDGLTKCAELMFHSVGESTQEGQEQSPDLLYTPRYFKFVHLGDGTNVVPAVSDDGLQKYARDSGSCYGGATGKMFYDEAYVRLVAGGFEWYATARIEWGGAYDATITEWCIGSESVYDTGVYLNHGLLDTPYVLTGETAATVRVRCLW